ncbi:exocyst complex component 3-like protein 4 [Bufo gargarizans]|uniref:exocyst complex component 3-like protein 4 n=1 Tax=Bufo gargarizans TaxID=30331 RepID=UPI001CF3CE46|nr:exocyst complex component 3-like protein 4 [Bufo gargarizans]
METSANGSHPKSTEDELLVSIDNGNLPKSPEKNLSFMKKIESLRMSKKNHKKPNEAGEISSPEKQESPFAKDSNVRSSKVFLKKQHHTEEPELSDKPETFGSLVFRLSKRSPNKVEKKEDCSSLESKGPPEGAGSLVEKWRRSMRGKKKIEYNEDEKMSTPEEPKSEDLEEPQMLSVMEINGLIQRREIKRAFINIELMEDKLLKDYSTNDFHENVTEYTIRGKDVDLLYGSLFNMIRSIVKDSLGQDPVDKSLISSVVYVINKEAETHKNPVVTPTNSEVPICGQPRQWKKLWKEAVKDSVGKQIESVPIKEGENGWLAEHLESLKSVSVEDLKKVKNSLKSLYPEDYDVCGTYLRSYNNALVSHLQKNIIPLALEFSQLYCLLDWTMNQYSSDDFMGNPELHAEINPLSLPRLLEGECLEKLKQAYVQALQRTIRTYLNNILEMEKRNWQNGEEAEELVLADSCHLPIYTDVEEIIGTHVRNSARLSGDLETSSSNACVEELGTFTTRLQVAFHECVSTTFTSLFAQYTVVYVNSFAKLRHNTTHSDAEQYRCAETKLTKAIKSLKQHFFDVFMEDTKPHFQKIITKNWLKKNTAFNAIMKSSGILCQWLKYLLPPYDKDFACGIHQYLVKEYISQIMKRKMRLNKLRRRKAAQKMREEGDLINKAADDMGSDLDSLHHAIHCISEIIGAKKKDEIEPKLDQLFHLHPDISEDHILCILHLHGIRKSTKLLRHFQKLQESRQSNPSSQDSQQPPLFSAIECSPQVACFTL